MGPQHKAELCKLQRWIPVQVMGVWLSADSQPKLINRAESPACALDCHFRTFSPSIFLNQHCFTAMMPAMVLLPQLTNCGI